jgi:hypothetical protein
VNDDVVREELVRIEAAIDLGVHALNGELDIKVGMRGILAHLRKMQRRLEQELP